MGTHARSIPVPSDVADYLASELPAVEAALERAIRTIEARGDVPADVAAAIRHGVTSGGKRLRPILCVTAWRACGGAEGDAPYDLAASIEMIHAYSLMHDDLPCMDDAELRRGRPTTHVELGEAVTTRAGAALIPLAALQALRSARALGCDEATCRDVADLLMRASGAGGMVGGQWVDLQGEGQALDATELDGLHRMKTGALLATSLDMGAVAARASGPVRAGLLEYGRAIGLAFQIADDILDATASAETLGKNPSDAELDKSTYVALFGLTEARGRAEAEVERAIEALRRPGVESAELEALARFVVERGS